MILEKFLASMLYDTLSMEGIVGIDDKGEVLVDENFADCYYILGDLIDMLDAGDINLEFIADKSGRSESFHELLTRYVYTT